MAIKYDVFISHSSKDRFAAREIAARLKQDGLRTLLDEWRDSADPVEINQKISQRLEQARVLVLLISADAIETSWGMLGRHAVLFHDYTDSGRRFIPIRLDNSEFPEILKQFAYIDWRQKSDEGYIRLLAACRVPLEETLTGADGERRSNTVPIKEFEGHTWRVNAISLSENGQLMISGGGDNKVRLWKLQSEKYIATLEGHTGVIRGVAFSANNKHAISCSNDCTARVWDLETNKCLAILQGHSNNVLAATITSTGNQAVTASADYTLGYWSVVSGESISYLKGHTAPVWSVAITKDDTRVISGAYDRTVKIWRLGTGACEATLTGHTDGVTCVAIAEEAQQIVSSSKDGTIRIWDLNTGAALGSLEGHHSEVLSVAVTPDGRLAVSGSTDETVRVWDLVSGNCIDILEWHSGSVNSVAVTNDGRRVVSANENNYILLWDLPEYEFTSVENTIATRYTNAKVLLVGESGAGKTGLAYRLTENRFIPTISTDAAWATQMQLEHKEHGSNVEREIWLWDFAGQADYRLVHQLYMDETALAVLVFNPQNEDPFEGIGQWDRDLQRAARRSFKKLLVAGRCDRGGLMISREHIERFCKERHFEQFIETSARSGAGCTELFDAILQNIPWRDIPWTASPRIFKLLKDGIIKLKDEGRVLLRTYEMKQQLELRLPGVEFTLEQLRAVIGLLAGPGIVWRLEFGDFVLLQPERINAYAAAVIRSVRAHTDEIGCISEEHVLTGKLDYQDMKRLQPDEEQIVLRAMHQTFIDHSLCLREPTDAGMLLVFPSYFKRERPALQTHPLTFITYQFSGALDEIYATLVVRLHHTPVFDKDQLWRFAADFKTQQGKRVGLKMVKKHEGSAEIHIYFETDIPDDTKVTFIRYVHDHLKAKDPDLIRIRHYICPHCNSPVETRNAVQDRLSRGLKDIVCVYCENRVLLWDLIEEKFTSDDFQRRVRELEALARISIDNESRELILVGDVFSITGEAGQIFRTTSNSDWGIDGEIEFKNDKGEASGKRIYLQLKSGDSYLSKRKRDSKEIFTIKNRRHIEYWQAQEYPVMLVIRTSNGVIRWMNISEYLKRATNKDLREGNDRDTREGNDRDTREGKDTMLVIFDGEPFTAITILKLRDQILKKVKSIKKK